LIVIGTSHGSCRHRQVPSGGKDLFIAELLPKLDIEIPAGILMTDQAAHYQAIGHVIYYPLFSSAEKNLPCPSGRLGQSPAACRKRSAI
jgi:hypothetical protein